MVNINIIVLFGTAFDTSDESWSIDTSTVCTVCVDVMAPFIKLHLL